jgi:hypothetical protein
MERDRADFAEFWILLGYDEKHVQYHVGCNFTAAKGELVIVDESDVPMLNDTENFIKLVNECACLCFTATPDDCDERGIEAKLIGKLGFSKHDYMIEPEHAAAVAALTAL